MNREFLYAVNTDDQTLAAGDSVDFGVTVRRSGPVHNNGKLLSLGGVKVDYYVDSNVTFTAGAAGTVLIQLYRNGVAIPGAETGATVTGDIMYTLPIHTVVYNYCPAQGNSIITMKITGVATTVNNVSTVVRNV